jgi:hypothetical protein
MRYDIKPMLPNKARGIPRVSDATSDSWLGRTANRGMPRLESSATTIFDS